MNELICTRTVFCSGVVFGPLDEHQQAEVSEKEEEKDDLREKLQEDGISTIKVPKYIQEKLKISENE